MAIMQNSSFYIFWYFSFALLFKKGAFVRFAKFRQVSTSLAEKAIRVCLCLPPSEGIAGQCTFRRKASVCALPLKCINYSYDATNLIIPYASELP